METISNEQKAREIAKKLSIHIDSFGDGDYEFDSQFYHTNKDAALQAMQWKDKQHKAEKQQWLEKACEWLKDNACHYHYLKFNHYTQDYDFAFDTQKLIDDFKKNNGIK